MTNFKAQWNKIADEANEIIELEKLSWDNESLESECTARVSKFINEHTYSPATFLERGYVQRDMMAEAYRKS